MSKHHNASDTFSRMKYKPQFFKGVCVKLMFKIGDYHSKFLPRSTILNNVNKYAFNEYHRHFVALML